MAGAWETPSGFVANQGIWQPEEGFSILCLRYTGKHLCCRVLEREVGNSISAYSGQKGTRQQHVFEFCSLSSSQHVLRTVFPSFRRLSSSSLRTDSKTSLFSLEILQRSYQVHHRHTFISRRNVPVSFGPKHTGGPGF